MGLILDSTFLIDSERKGLRFDDALAQLFLQTSQDEARLSAVSVIELEHGYWRAVSPEQRKRRREYLDAVYRALIIEPLTYRIALLAGKIDGLTKAAGQTIATPDLQIGATAQYLGFGLATHNVRHFRMIPGLQVHEL